MVHLTDQTFQKEALQAHELVLVDFWAAWCYPCRVMEPVIEEISGVYAGKGLKIAKLNVDENIQTAGQYRIMSIPTILFFKNGQVVDQVTGTISKERLKEKIEKLINA